MDFQNLFHTNLQSEIGNQDCNMGSNNFPFAPGNNLGSVNDINLLREVDRFHGS